MAESLRSFELVHAIAGCGHSHSAVVTDSTQYLLCTVLPRSLVSHSVLSMLRGMPRPDWYLFPDPEPFPNPQLWDACRKCNTMTTENNEIFQAYDIGGYESNLG